MSLRLAPTVTRRKFVTSSAAAVFASASGFAGMAPLSQMAARDGAGGQSRVIIDTDHWRHFFLLLGLIWGLTAASINLLRRDLKDLLQQDMAEGDTQVMTRA